MNKFLTSRIAYFLGFFVSFGLVGFALYIQQKDGLEPCPLCISQRIAYMATGIMFLLAGVINPKAMGRKIFAGLQLIAALTGAGVALRHMWIQAHADEVMAECGAGFSYIFERFPFKKALELVFKGTGECTAIDWKMLGLTIPQWSLICFSGLAVYAVLIVISKKN